MAHGYRPSTNIPVHHQTMIQSLGLTFLKLQHEHHDPHPRPNALELLQPALQFKLIAGDLAVAADTGE
jgi:hypothetical protein